MSKSYSKSNSQFGGNRDDWTFIPAGVSMFSRNKFLPPSYLKFSNMYENVYLLPTPIFDNL